MYNKYGEKREITAAQRGEVAEWVASAKIVTTDTGLKVTAGVFEVCFIFFVFPSFISMRSFGRFLKALALRNVV